ncbi:MAG: hypothetical protein GC204_03435 [Chloroflexi bacterium]|nr:hypothetical protein [Chloroflexota bacterium]
MRQLTDAQQVADGSYWGAPLWSPDGQSIAYQAVSGGVPSIVIVGLDGSVRQRIRSGQQAVFPTLLDGERTAYLAPIGARSLFYLINADGSNPRALSPIDAIQTFSALWTTPAS